MGAERASQAEMEAARTLLASKVASAYVQLGRLFAQREVAERALAQRDQILGLIRQRVQGGLDTNVELRQGEAALPETRQQIEAIDEQIALTRHALAALTAQAPDALDELARAARRRARGGAAGRACRPTCWAAAPTSAPRAGASRPRRSDDRAAPRRSSIPTST